MHSPLTTPSQNQKQPDLSKKVLDKLNRPMQDLRISVIDRCNFRCPYCMPEEEYSKHYTFLKQTEWLNFKEITRLAKIFVEQGVRKIRITGGEPLLRPDLPELIFALKAIEGIEDLALTTNGMLLKEHAGSLKQSGLNRVTVSLDTLEPDIFHTLSGGKGALKHILDGIDAAVVAGIRTLKVNTVIQKGVNEDCVLKLVEHFRHTGHILRFIEYMDVGNCNHWSMQKVVPSKEIFQRIQAAYPLEAISANYYGEVAERYRFKDGSGEIGFISSVTQPFCRNCTRLRLSADGKIYTCLFSDKGLDLRAELRDGASDDELSDLIRLTWQEREDRYSEYRSAYLKAHSPAHKVEMFQIGG